MKWPLLTNMAGRGYLRPELAQLVSLVVVDGERHGLGVAAVGRGVVVRAGADVEHG